ncbi:MAG: hypothetical protein QY325_11765 [Flavobacteriales bacterium]|nr:MAG: hypothetical protein QY325_11765 [Flavobacteriales bacterium]
MEELPLDVVVGLCVVSLSALCLVLIPAQRGVCLQGRFVAARVDAVRVVLAATGRSTSIGKHGDFRVWTRFGASAKWIIHYQGMAVGSIEFVQSEPVAADGSDTRYIEAGAIDLDAWLGQTATFRVMHQRSIQVRFTPARCQPAPKSHRLLDHPSDQVDGDCECCTHITA